MENFTTVKLRPKQDGRSWAIVGVKADKSFAVLGVLDDPIAPELVRKIAALIAEQFGATLEEVDLYSKEHS